MPTSIPENIWRQYDIRGIFPKEINVPLAEAMGKAFGTLIKRSGKKSIVVACDARISSPELQQAVIDGILSTGCDVQDIGMVPTPLMYFAVIHFQYDAGIVITASHNPPQYNGFKMRTYDRALYGDDIQVISRIVKNSDFEYGKGTQTSLDVISPYLEYMQKNLSLQKSLSVIIDAGNGIAGPTAVQLFKNLGCEVIPLFCDPDGNYPNHEPDPTIPENMITLREKVLSTGVDLGIGFDGDGDRVAVMSPTGELLWGDKMLAVFAESILKDNPGPIIFDVKCSMGLIEKIEEKKGTPVMWKTGYPLIQEKMKETQSVLAGEMSGHMYFSDRYYGFDDGIYAACRFAEILSSTDQSMTDLVAALPDYPSTPELRLFCPEEKKFQVMQTLSSSIGGKYSVITVDGIRFTTPSGWGLLRVSNTQPAIVARFEAKTPAELKQIMTDAIEIIQGTPVDIAPIQEQYLKFR